MKADRYRVTAIWETISKTAMEDYKVGDLINLERCMLLSQRIDGHIVQGHIDGVGTISNIDIKDGSWEYIIDYEKQYAELVIEKGSIAVDGISLTCHSLVDNRFKVSIIPYTYEHTRAKEWKVKDRVNLEFDLLGKYLQRRIQVNS
jgi:riboflavin synthase